jgi:hypothetical protein
MQADAGVGRPLNDSLVREVHLHIILAVTSSPTSASLFNGSNAISMLPRSLRIPPC